MTQERTVERLRGVWDTPGVLHSTSTLDSLSRENEHYHLLMYRSHQEAWCLSFRFFMWQLNYSNTDYITCTGYCHLTPAGNVRRPSEALLGSGLRLLAMIHHQNPLTMCLKRKWCVSSSMDGTEYESCGRKVMKRRQLLFYWSVLAVTGALSEVLQCDD